MKVYYLCPKCKSLYDNSMVLVESVGKGNGLFVCGCGVKIRVSNAIPDFPARDLQKTCENIYEQCKQTDKNNSKLMKTVMEELGIEWDITRLDKYINEYESIIEKYDANYYVNGNITSDLFEDTTDLCADECDAFFVAFSFYKNTDRKLAVITAASYLELMFNDYQKLVIKSILPETGVVRFLKSNEKNGIARNIELIDWFLEESFVRKCNRIEKGFLDRWTELRSIRNEIIHNNSKYISKIKLAKLMKIIDRSSFVFAKLTQEICQEANIQYSNLD